MRLTGITISTDTEWIHLAPLVSLVLVAFSAACTGSSGDGVGQPSEPGQEQVLLKGHAIFGHEVRTIRPCDGEEILWAIDSTGLLWEIHQELALGMQPYEEIFVVVRGIARAPLRDGFGAEYAGAFAVEQVLYAAREGFGCDLDLDSFQFRMSGNEPFWTLLVTNGTVELSRMGASSTTWTDVRLRRTESGFSYVAEVNDPEKLEVSVTEAPCRDSMSGAFYGHQAQVVVSSETLTGCALRGTGEFRPE